MASREQLIFDLITGKDNLTPTLTKSEKKSKKIALNIGKGLTKAFRGVTGAVFSFKSALAGAGGAFAVKGAIRQAVELENALIGLQSVAKNTGNSVDFMTDQAKELASDGLIPLTDVSNSLKNLLATGLDGKKAVEVFKALRESASFNRQGQLELGEAVRGATEGLKNDLSIKVDNAGITKNLSVLQKEYAQSIGKTVGRLTNAEKIQSKYVGILKEAKLFQGDYNQLLETFSGAQSKASGETRFLVAEFGSFITKSPIAVEFVSQLAKSFKGLRKFLVENREAIQKFVNTGLKNIIKTSPIVLEGLKLISTGYLKLSNAVLVVTDTVLSFWKTIADTEAFKFIAEFAVEAFSAVSFAFAQMVESIVGTGIGAKIAESLGFDPEAIKESAKGVQETLLNFAGEFEGGEIGEALGNASNAVKQAFLFNDENLESLEEGFDKAKELIDGFNKSILEADNERTRIAVGNEKKRGDAGKTGIEKQKKDNKAFYDFSLKQEELTGRQKVQLLKGTLGSISTLTSSNNKALFAVGKAASIANATIDGIAAVQKALASAPAPFNFILAGLVGVATAANIAKLASAKPPGAQTGGILDPNGSSTSGDLLPFRGNSGEAILTKGQQKRFIDLADGAQPGAGGNELIEELRALRAELAQQPIVLNIDQREVARAVRDEVKGGFALG